MGDVLLFLVIHELRLTGLCPSARASFNFATVSIKKLGNNNACSTDNTVYEYFKVCSDIIARPLELFFNHILNTQ